jgi:hypothetical protein
MFSISDELARAFLNPNIDAYEEVLLAKAKEFEKRKLALVTKISKTLTDQPASKVGGKFISLRSRSTSPAHQSNSRRKSH